MLVPIADHLWQSTLLVLGACLLAWILRAHSAHLRYWIWLAASLKFLVPFSLLVALGSALPWRVDSTPGNEALWHPLAADLMQPARVLAFDRPSSSPHPNSPPSAVERRLDTQSPVTSPAESLEEAPAARARAQRFLDAARAPQISSDALTGGTPPAAPRSTRPSLAAAALGVWALGFVLIAVSWFRRWTRLRALCAGATLFAGGATSAYGLDVRIARSSIEPGVFGLLRPVLLLPEGIVERLTPLELDAIIRHERAHIERHDNLTALSHMLVTAFFWFYPPVWWVGARLVAERERACDEAVLASGIARGAYAKSIVAVGNFYVESPLPCAAGVAGGTIEARVREILAERRLRPLGVFGNAVLLALPAVMLLTPCLIGLLGSAPAKAQPAEPPITWRMAESDEERHVWAPLPGAPPLVIGFGNNSDGSQFTMSLRWCVVADAAETRAGAGEIGPLPSIASFADLVAYAYDLERSELAGPRELGQPRLRVAEAAHTVGGRRIEFAPLPSVEHARCRALLRRALEEGYGLEWRRDDTGKFKVEAIDIPEVPRPLSERPLPPVAVDAAVLDRYVGYYEGFLDTRARDFSSIFAFRRDGGNLVLDWHAGGSDRSFVLLPLGETAFSTLRRYESRLFGKPSVDVYFSEGPQGMVVSIGTSQDVPAVVARAVDTTLAQEMLADIDRRMAENLPAQGSREIVDAIVERLLNGDVGGDSLAAMAARALGEQLEAWRPTALANRGELEGIALERVLRSGRDVYAVRFANLAFEITVVNGIESAVDGVLLDAFCRRRGETARSELEPCIAPLMIGIEPYAAPPLPAALRRNGLATLQETTLFRDGYGISRAGAWAHSLLLQGCYSSIRERTATPEARLDVPYFTSLSELVRYAFALEPAELAWPADVGDDPIGVTVFGRGEGLVLRNDDCQSNARRELAEEIDLAGRFEMRRVPAAWRLTTPAGVTLDAPTNRTPAVWGGDGSILGVNATMQMLAAFIEERFGEPVVDDTGIAASFDFAFVWPAASSDAPDRRERDLASMRELLSRAGLTLERAERNVEQLVIERAVVPPLPAREPPQLRVF